MPHRYYPRNMPRDEVLELLRRGHYRVDLESGAIYGRRGRLTKGNRPNRSGGRQIVKLYYERATATILTSHLVWMAGNDAILPPGHEVHHRDGDPRNDAFDNLFALTRVDHAKLHGKPIHQNGKPEEDF